MNVEGVEPLPLAPWLGRSVREGPGLRMEVRGSYLYLAEGEPLPAIELGHPVTEVRVKPASTLLPALDRAGKPVPAELPLRNEGGLVDARVKVLTRRTASYRNPLGRQEAGVDALELHAVGVVAVYKGSRIVIPAESLAYIVLDTDGAAGRHVLVPLARLGWMVE